MTENNESHVLLFSGHYHCPFYLYTYLYIELLRKLKAKGATSVQYTVYTTCIKGLRYDL